MLFLSFFFFSFSRARLLIIIVHFHSQQSILTFFFRVIFQFCMVSDLTENKKN